MQLISDLYQIDHCSIVFSEHFDNNRRKWEEVHLDTEQAIISEGSYQMANTSKGRWNYYKTKTGLKPEQDFIIEATIVLENNTDVFGHFGLVWGFDEERKYLNRFTLSADGRRALVMHFEKDHHDIVHRFQNRNISQVATHRPVQFTIVKIDSYYHFFLNKKKVYMAHASFFCASGSYAGYYIEPELSMKSDFFEVKKINVRNVWAITGLHQLMSD